MTRTRRALKRAKSIRLIERRLSTFTYVVRRQQGKCWYCAERMGADCSKEHLYPQKLGGTDTWPRGNLKAAHGECNSVVGHLPVSIKRYLRKVCLEEGKQAFFILARQYRRADARAAFGAEDVEDLTGD